MKVEKYHHDLELIVKKFHHDHYDARWASLPPERQAKYPAPA